MVKTSFLIPKKNKPGGGFLKAAGEDLQEKKEDSERSRKNG